MGTWYAKDWVTQVKQLLDGQMEELACSPAWGIVVPHAALSFSGRTAGSAFARMRFIYTETVVLLATHHAFTPGFVLPGFSTIDFGEGHRLHVDDSLMGKLNDTGLFSVDTSGSLFRAEHSWEMQVPFLMRGLAHADTRVLPILVGDLRGVDVAGVAKALLDNAPPGSKFLYVVTSDFTHYGPAYKFQLPGAQDDPAGSGGPLSSRSSFDSTPWRVLQKDAADIRAVMTGDVDALARGGASVCGKNALLTWLEVLRQREKGGAEPLEAVLTGYARSGPASEGSSTVSYVGMEFTDTCSPYHRMSHIPRLLAMLLASLMPPEGGSAHVPILDERGSDLVFAALRRAGALDLLPLVALSKARPERLEARGVFVTVEDARRKLQGCMGMFTEEVKRAMARDTRLTLGLQVARMSLEALFVDDRFPASPLRFFDGYTDGRLFNGSYSFTVSFLADEFPVKAERFWATYLPCEHGITLRYKGRYATFLPSVMPTEKWIKCPPWRVTDAERAQFEVLVFSALFRKMGLSNVDWSEWKNAEVLLYEAEEFEER
jgi:AmmeMemoRadiSam system protein B